MDRTFSPRVRSFLFSLVMILSFGHSLIYGQEKNWPPVTPEELAMTDCPEQPGAPAILLYHERIEDRTKSLLTVFKRIKILTPAGRDYANLEVKYIPELQSVEKIQARIISPDGQTKDYKGNILEKTAVKVGPYEAKIKTLAIPDISPGYIIDFRYELRTKEINVEGFVFNIGAFLPAEPGSISSDFYTFSAASWDLQENIFTRKIKFVFEADRSIAMLFRGRCRLAWVTNKLKGATPTVSGNKVELVAENIPPWEKEKLMPPESTERIKVDILFIDNRVKSADDFWEKAAKDWKDSADKFIGGRNGLNDIVRSIVGEETSELTKLQKIYERVQKIENLSYAEEKTSKEEKKYKENKRVMDVLKRNYGYRNQITRTFVGLARAAGFEAYLVRAVNRNDKIFRQMLPLFYNQFDTEIALVKVNGRVQAFDPGTPFCPFGLVYWPMSNTAGITFEGDKMTFFTTPVFPPDLALSQREVSLEIDPEGNLTGKVKITYQGQEALIRRIRHIHSDEVKKKEDLENELKKILPPESKVKMTGLSGLDNSSAQLVVEYEVIIPGLTTPAGDKLLLQIYPLVNPERYPFSSPQRKYPVYFPYPYREFDDIVISLPESMSLEAVPEAKKKETDFSSFSLVKALENPQRLHIQRDFSIKKSYFPVNQYPALKDFFDFARASDEEQIILTKK